MSVGFPETAWLVVHCKALFWPPTCIVQAVACCKRELRLNNEAVGKIK